MLPDRVSNPGPLTYESGALPIALRGPARERERGMHGQRGEMVTQIRRVGKQELGTKNTLVSHKLSRSGTWDRPDVKQYTLARGTFRFGVYIRRTSSFPGADTGSDHKLVIMTFHDLSSMSEGV